LKDRTIYQTVLFSGSFTLNTSEGNSKDLEADLSNAKLAWIEVWAQCNAAATAGLKAAVHLRKYGTTNWQSNPFTTIMASDPSNPGVDEEWPSTLLDCQAFDEAMIRITNRDTGYTATLKKVILHAVV